MFIFYLASIGHLGLDVLLVHVVDEAVGAAEGRHADLAHQLVLVVKGLRIFFSYEDSGSRRTSVSK